MSCEAVSQSGISALLQSKETQESFGFRLYGEAVAQQTVNGGVASSNPRLQLSTGYSVFGQDLNPNSNQLGTDSGLHGGSWTHPLSW